VSPASMISALALFELREEACRKRLKI